MKQAKRKPLLNRNETRTLLTTLKLATVAGTLSLTMAGWGLLAYNGASTNALAAGQTVTVAAAPSKSSRIATNSPTQNRSSNASAASSKQVIRLDVVQWVQDTAGRPVAVVRDRRGTLWYVMGSDVPRIEQGQQPLFPPQPVRTVSRTTAS